MKKIIIAETDRLILRRFIETDEDDLYEYMSDAETLKYEPYKPSSKEENKKMLFWLISNTEMTAIALKTTNKVIGHVFLGKRPYQNIELGYVLNKAYWKKGYAFEACHKMISLTFEEGINRIYAQCDTNNLNSWKLLERLLFRREAHHIKNIYYWEDDNGLPIWKDTFIYAKLKVEK